VGNRRIRFDTQLTAPLGHEAAATAELADQGVDGIFTFEGAHDVFLPLVPAAGAGLDLDLMTNVAIALPRSPIHLAHAAWDLQVLSRGRFRLGIGSQIRPQIERRYGAAFAHPVERMREWTLAIKAILACWEGTAPLDFRGAHTSHTLMTPTFDPGPNPFGPPPVLLGALGPRMTELAAQVADGVLVMPFNSRSHLIERTLPAIDRGLALAGRPSRTEGTRGFEIVAEVIVGCGRDERELAAAEAGVRALLSFYGSTPSYRPVLDVEGWSELQPELNRLSKAGAWTAMAALVEPEMISTLAVLGDPAHCAAEILHRFGDVADRIAFYQPYRAVPATTAALLDELRHLQEAGRE